MEKLLSDALCDDKVDEILVGEFDVKAEKIFSDWHDLQQVLKSATEAQLN